MRILHTFTGGSGHLNPQLPLARAAEAAGHTVAFACQQAMVAAVADAGFTAFGTGGDTLGTTTLGPLVALDSEREDRGLRDGFARRVAGERVPRLLEVCADWKPDLIVWDEVDYGAAIAAERLGLPHASVLVIAAGSFNRAELVAEPLGELRAEHCLPPDPGMSMLSRYLVLSPVPPSYRDPGFPLPGTAHAFRPPRGDESATAPAWLAALPYRTTAYVTLGTIFNVESGDLFPRVLAGLREMPANVVVTVGPHVDPARFGPQPGNVHIEQHIPQSVVLPRCDVVVSHGGSGSVMGALAHGLPAVLVPLGADQPHNARRCRELGVAEVLDAVTATPQDIRAAVSTVLADPGYRRAAERLRDEIAALPDPARAVALLERLAAEKCPIVRS
ncbi:glycosyltransferase family 1 protein [Saccharopolyspora erythraea]|uniref:glycosyltransferase n=1 Tax=Saccharopolyspora erythraea TaxID=1836 RepID=UPI001BAD8139|nr:glycosyltransferase [Saccharopolyspora erythraea]QUH00786.1 glycosyltransferase family 1 protein [Saccharopolyspora erythraea]